MEELKVAMNEYIKSLEGLNNALDGVLEQQERLRDDFASIVLMFNNLSE
jgi:hypothetical protein